jgi:hypothetical protein
MLADDLAEAVADFGATVTPVRWLRRLLRLLRRLCRLGARAQFFDRTDTDPIGFAECAVDGSGFGDAHLGTVD